MTEHKQRNYKIISLFSGCGGGDLGFHGGFYFLNNWYERLPFKIIWANDIDKFASAVYSHNLRGQLLTGNIRNIKFEALGLDNDDIDVLVAGFPCQEFSFRGLRGGLKSERGRLYKEIRRTLRYFQPKVFFAENVPGIEHPPTMLATIMRGLSGRKAPRYRVNMYRINAADYGVPQVRKRILLVGVRSDLTDNFIPPQPVRSPPNSNSSGVFPWLTVQDALEDLCNPQNLKGKSIPDQDKITHATIMLKPGSFRDRRLNPASPAPTIRAEHHGHVEVHYRNLPDGSLRRLTVRECARLQGFPDSFVFPVSATQAYRQIGNAMPPVLVHHWAESIARYLERHEYELKSGKI